MPTLVWIRRPKSSTGAAAGRDSARKAAPDPLGSAAVPNSAVSSGVALPATSSNRINRFAGTRTDEGMKKKRKINRAKAATTAKKKSKATSERDLPRGVQKMTSGKFRSEIRWRGKTRHIGTFHTPEQASAAYMSFKNDIAGAETSALFADEIDSIFDAASKKAVEAVGGRIRKKRRAKAPTERDLPQGVKMVPSGRFHSVMHWRGKQRAIGTFDTPEQASAAFMLVRRDLDDAKLSMPSADEVDAAFDKAKTKALEAVGGFVTRDLPRGVKKMPSGKFQSQFWWGGKKRHIGTFDTPEQASAAYMSVRKDLDDANLSALGASEVDAAFDEAKNNALASFGGFVPEERDLPRGVRKSSSEKFTSIIWWGGKERYIGSFDTPEQASAAYMSVRKDLDDAKARTCASIKDISAMFDAAKNNALEAVIATR